MREETAKIGLYLATGAAALLTAIGVVITLVLHSGEVFTGWLLLPLQVLVLLFAAAIAYAVSKAAIDSATAHFAAKLAEVERRYQHELAALRKRTPTIVAFTAIAAEGALLVADKSFHENPWAAAAVSFIMLVGFWLCNRLITSAIRAKRLVGLVSWFMVLGYLPLAVLLLEHITPAQLLDQFVALELPTKLLCGISVLLLVVAPFTPET